jgi:hypothetical protein
VMQEKQVARGDVIPHGAVGNAVGDQVGEHFRRR